MAKYSKPSEQLYHGPVDELCGNPSERSGGSGVEHGGESTGPFGSHKESSGAFETVTYYEGLEDTKEGKEKKGAGY